MIKLQYLRPAWIASVLLVLMSSAALAQSPQRTTATFEDWTERCDIITGPPQQKVCEVAQIYSAQGQQVAQLVIGREKKGDPFKLLFGAPVNVWLPTGAKFIYTDKDAPIEATFKRCIPGTCYAESDIKEDVVKKLRAVTENGKIQFKDGTQRDVTLAVSFKGFAQAIDALLKE